MRAYLALDALEGVVHRLCVAAQALAHLLVGVAVEVKREHSTLQLREGGREAAHQRAQLLGGDDLVDGIVDRGAWEHLVERWHFVARSCRRRGKGHVLIQRRVLVACRRLHRRDDLTCDAKLCEVAEAGLTVGTEVADRLVEADQPLLYQVFRISSSEEVRRGLQTYESVVSPDETVISIAFTLLCQIDQERVLDLWFRVRVMRNTGHEQFLS